MFSSYKVSILRKAPRSARRPRSIALFAALFLLLVAVAGLGARPAYAIPPEPIPEPPDGGDPYVPPDGGFDWSRPSRVAQAYFAWIPDVDSPFVPGHYDPAYVNPTSFSVRFDGCQTATEEKFGTSSNTYAWTLKGNTIANNQCRFTDTFPAQGTYPVSLKITAADGAVILPTVTQNVVVKDLLVVAMGDSYASGEGNPDVPQELNYIFGVPVVVKSAVWWDARCHRSMNAPSAQAARAIEQANPLVSVTYLNFACSGATINKLYYDPDDVNALDPYRTPNSTDRPVGTGILGPYAGPMDGWPVGGHPEQKQVPPQINQLTTTLTLNGPARQIDALILDGGGNDIGFGLVASVCTLYGNCPTHQVKSNDSGTFIPLKTQAQFYGTNLLAARYAALKQAVDQTNLPIAHKYIVEYPDSTSDDNGNFCNTMLDDVIPDWMAPLLAGLAATDPSLAVPLPPYRLDRGNSPDQLNNPDFDEVYWAGTQVLPQLNAAIIAAAQTNNWTLVDGIADDKGNLFKYHGYCASDNWIRRASEAVMLQGPLYSFPAPGTTKTTGTLHPTTTGYGAMAGRMFAKLAPDLMPNPGPQPTPPTFNAPDLSQSVKGANGWLTGHVAGVSCPASASNCALLQQGASVDASTTVAGSALSINGAATACPIAPTLLGSVICSAQVLSHTVAWSFAFPNDGVYRLEYSVSARNGAIGSTSQEVKVDLHDPTTTYSLSVDMPATGWYRLPVTVTLSGADGVGSGIQSVQYQLDGGSAQTVNGNAVSARLGQDGTHTLAYQVKDFAGRSSAAQSLTVKLDQMPPAITISTPISTAYLLNQVVTAGYVCSDGGSGVATCAGPVANNANIDTASPGTKTFTVNAGDTAGNSASKTVSYQVGYNICVLFDQTKSYKLGSTVPVKLQLCDAKGANFSAAGVLPLAAGLAQKDSTASSDVVDSGNANPDSAFRFDATLNGYIYNLSTKGLTTGTWVLNFTVPGDPVSHAVQFDVR